MSVALKSFLYFDLIAATSSEYRETPNLSILIAGQSRISLHRIAVMDAYGPRGLTERHGDFPLTIILDVLWESHFD